MPPYQPICIICLGDCDPQGVITSCNHFFCSRCNARLPPTANHACPACKKPSYGRMHLSNSSLTPLFQDVSQSFATTVKVATSQQQHAQQIVARMRGALKLLNSKYQESTEQLKQCRGSLAQSEATVQQLTQQVQRLQEELHRRGAHPSPSQHYAPPPPRDQPPNNNNNSSLHKPLGWSTTSQIAAKRVREESVPHRSEEPPAATYMTPNTCLQSLSLGGHPYHNNNNTANSSGRKSVFRLSTPLLNTSLRNSVPYPHNNNNNNNNVPQHHNPPGSSGRRERSASVMGFNNNNNNNKGFGLLGPSGF